MLSDKKVKDLIFKIERHPDTFKYEAQGVSLFFLLRFSIEMEIRKAYNEVPDNLRVTGAQNNAHKKKQIPKQVSKIRAWVNQRIIHLKFRRYISLPGKLVKTPCIFVAHLDITPKRPRTENLLAALKYLHKKKLTTTLVINDFTQKTKKPSYLKQLLFLFSFPPAKNVSKVQLPVTFLEHLKQLTQVDFTHCQASWESNINTQLSNASRLEQIIAQTSCQHVFCSSAYTNAWIILACHRQKVNCVEIQHGVITQEQAYYQASFPPSELSPLTLLMPDYILTLGKKWQEIIVGNHYAHTNQNTLVLGNIALSNVSESPQAIPQNGLYHILVATQPGIFDIKDTLVELCTRHKEELLQNNMMFTIRPHPLHDFDFYRELCSQHPKIFQFDNSRKTHIYASLNQVNAVLSNTSMCLYEALALQKTAISFEKFKTQTVEEDLKFVKTTSELIRLLLEEKEHKPSKHPDYLSVFEEGVLDKFYK
ncbi:MAG TPA: hypothetical protein DCS93_44285 [Microscillaceae bacterium]|nr:hypothetical protein [Microscillaceae bacterium]